MSTLPFATGARVFASLLCGLALIGLGGCGSQPSAPKDDLSLVRVKPTGGPPPEAIKMMQQAQKPPQAQKQ